MPNRGAKGTGAIKSEGPEAKSTQNITRLIKEVDISDLEGALIWRGSEGYGGEMGAELCEVKWSKQAYSASYKNITILQTPASTQL